MWNKRRWYSKMMLRWSNSSLKRRRKKCILQIRRIMTIRSSSWSQMKLNKRNVLMKYQMRGMLKIMRVMMKKLRMRKK